MNTEILYFLVSLLTILFPVAHSQTDIRSCERGTSCIRLRECPKILEDARSTNFESRNRYRQSICRFVEGRIYVCCPTKATSVRPVVFFPTDSPVSPPTPRPPVSTSGESLLPRQCGESSTQDRIIGGEVAPLGAYPWMVALVYREIGIPELKVQCAGSLINNRYVLTAAHCVDKSQLGNRNLHTLRVGDWDIGNSGDCETRFGATKCYGPHVERGIERTIIHPNYNKRARDSDDIALLRMDSPIDFDDRSKAPVTPICIPPKHLNAVRAAEGRRAIVSGWGYTEFNSSGSDILLRVRLPMADENICREKYGSRFVGNQLCVGGVRLKDSCSGDSGGPLILPGPQGPPFLQIGIVSFGPFPCGSENFPGVYTSVADFRDWIVENLRP